MHASDITMIRIQWKTRRLPHEPDKISGFFRSMYCIQNSYRVWQYISTNGKFSVMVDSSAQTLKKNTTEECTLWWESVDQDNSCHWMITVEQELEPMESLMVKNDWDILGKFCIESNGSMDNQVDHVSSETAKRFKRVTKSSLFA